MKPLEEFPTCEKCGFGEYDAFKHGRSTWHPYAPLCEFRRTQYFDIETGEVIGPETGEYMLRTCQRCGYKWAEAVK